MEGITRCKQVPAASRQPVRIARANLVVAIVSNTFTMDRLGAEARRPTCLTLDRSQKAALSSARIAGHSIRRRLRLFPRAKAIQQNVSSASNPWASRIHSRASSSSNALKMTDAKAQSRGLRDLKTCSKNFRFGRCVVPRIRSCQHSADLEKQHAKGGKADAGA